ncbi:cullin-1, putative [Plasmodium ovale curtisi]|uniref:Cullin-1, putative n=2 Tax=Plasmodium ovale TaxID=36330 RepID=A0A1A8X200_PLAOA|nr:cullin-1, putative [Plasmodium ovale curtisi]SBS98191.1 cullin-1, putative [Plasmodium ovale curtisi]
MNWSEEKMDITNLNFESGWKIIKEEAMEKIEKHLENETIESSKNLFSAKEYTRLYTVVYSMCAKKSPFCYSKEVYRKYGECLSIYIVEKIKPLLEYTCNIKKTKALINAWHKYSFYTNWMNKFLRYLDRYYVEYNSSLCLNAYTKNIFKMTLFNDHRDCIKHVVYEIYDNLRINEKEEEKKLFSDIVLLCKELDKESNEKMYEHDIEKKILENVENYYKNEGDKWIDKLTFDNYIISIEKAIEIEFEKNKYLNLNEETCEKVTNVIVRILIYEKLSILLRHKENIFDLLKNNNLHCLRRTYILFSYFSEAIEGLKRIIGEYIKNEGNTLKEKYIEMSKICYRTQKNEEILYEPNKNSNITENKEEYVLCEYIEKLIKLHNHYHDVFKLSFFSISNNTIDDNFKECLKDYFESFVEHEDEHFSTVKLLVLYADNMLKRKGANWGGDDNSIDDLSNYGKGRTIVGNEYSEETVDLSICEDASSLKDQFGFTDKKTDTSILMKKMSDVVEIFNYTSNKESFFDYYRIYLANRLINNIYISLNVEKKFIENLYYLCGSQYTSKLGGMIQDMINNDQLNSKFLDFLEKKLHTCGGDANYGDGTAAVGENASGNSDDHCEVLTSQVRGSFLAKILNKGYWPVLEKTNMKLNDEFHNQIALFEQFYKSDNKNKKLEWIYELSEIILEYPLNGTLYYLYCNMVNAHILLLFNKYKYINYDIIKNELHIDLKTCTDNMYSCLNYFKIVYSPDDIINWSSSNFFINPKFSYPHKNVYIKKTTTLLSKEHEKTKEDRTMAIEAAIVRVMKIHKKLFYDQIFEYVRKSLSIFSPTNQAIEKKIDLLVEREYIQKEENSQVYLYIP